MFTIRTIIYILRQEEYIYSGIPLKGIPFFDIRKGDRMNYGYQNEYDFVELFNGKYIYELDDNQIYVDEQYSLIRTSLSELLNKGENMNRLEVLRDFNGWNWNTSPKEIGEVTLNLIYQNNSIIRKAYAFRRFAAGAKVAFHGKKEEKA